MLSFYAREPDEITTEVALTVSPIAISLLKTPLPYRYAIFTQILEETGTPLEHFYDAPPMQFKGVEDVANRCLKIPEKMLKPGKYIYNNLSLLGT